MWTALVRQLVLFVLTQRGKKIITIVGVLLLCFVTVLLIDSRMYLSAGFVGALCAAVLVTFTIRYFRNHKERREREHQRAEEAERRAAAAQARSEKLDRAKATLADAAKAASSSAASVAGRLNVWRNKQ